MTRTAKAAVLVAPRQVEMREYPIPETGDDDALLRIEACGVCASDVPTYTGSRETSFMELPVIL
ncbi:MAG: alcohol dehydrogenase catalytic domain-containing protein, partial [Chloroflexi bacterium]|nr:alcohol dehydrogenase catalytic domain-containing protein [Chloroflexota bacterium]